MGAIPVKAPPTRETRSRHARAQPRTGTVDQGRLTPLSLSHANTCNPLLQAHPTWARDNTEAAGSPLLFLPLCVPSRADPSGLGHAATIYSSVQGPPPGSKRRQLACQVGACCVLTNSFPSSSRWGVSSNLSNPGRSSVSGVSSSCPSTAATT
jgi:hypothetical protein